MADKKRQNDAPMLANQHLGSVPHPVLLSCSHMHLRLRTESFPSQFILVYLDFRREAFV